MNNLLLHELFYLKM